MTVTLDHRHGGGWDRTVLDGVWARWSLGAARDSTVSRDDGGESLLLIPWREDLALSLGDGACPGIGPDLTAGPLKAQLPDVRILTEIILHRPGSPLDHWEVKAR